jgi:hypothetical protein
VAATTGPLERVDYDGTVAIAFRPNGIKTLAEW